MYDMERKIVLKENTPIYKDKILELRGTKALSVEHFRCDNEAYMNRQSWSEVLSLADKNGGVHRINVTTWSSSVRAIITMLQDSIQKAVKQLGSSAFRNIYKDCLDDILNSTAVIPNCNFTRELYTDDNHRITSSVYLNNKNHKIKIFTDENGIEYYACAVYTGEIIWVIQALLNTISSINKTITTGEPEIVDIFIITYIDRAELSELQTRCEHILTPSDNVDPEEDISECNEDVHTEELERDLISMSLKLKEILMYLYEMSDKTVSKQAKGFIKGLYTEDVPRELLKK
jgi:predicted DNA binding protein